MNQDIKHIKMKYLDEVSTEKDFKIKIFSMFRNEIVIVERNMLEALKEKNYDLLADLAHKAKSSVSIMGMDKVSAEMKQLEIDIKNGLFSETYESRVRDFLVICKEALQEIEIIEQNL